MSAAPTRKAPRSYGEQFDDLKGSTQVELLRSAYPKPHPAPNAFEKGAYRLPWADFFCVVKQRPLIDAHPNSLTEHQARRMLKKQHVQRVRGFILIHALLLVLGPFTFSWRNLLVGEIIRFLTTCLGITIGYHRLLTHHGFSCPKWVFNLFATLGTISGQGGPIEWVSNHRAHHVHCDTPLDPHSPYEGFWWSHMGWLVNKKAAVEKPLLDRANAADLTSQPYVVWLDNYHGELLLLRMVVTLLIGGWSGLVWGLCWPQVASWHVTFLVNSACHIWGTRPYATGDLSTNNWWVALLAYGEGWHNSHHAFASSARHGLEWWEFDVSYMVICFMEAVGLAWDVQLPTEQQRAAKRVPGGGLERGFEVFAKSRYGSRLMDTGAAAAGEERVRRVPSAASDTGSTSAGEEALKQE